MNLTIEAEKIKCYLAKKYFRNKCAVCGTRISKKGMTIHHMWYIFNDVVYHNYPKTVEGKYKYYAQLKPIVEKEPKRFRYLCNTDHQSLERLFRYGDKKLNKLLLLRKEMKKH